MSVVTSSNLCLFLVQWRARGQGSKVEYFGVHPDVPYGDAHIISAQLDLLQETQSGLNTTQYWINNIQSYGNAVKYTVQLYCDESRTPWCNWPVVSSDRI